MRSMVGSCSGIGEFHPYGGPRRRQIEKGFDPTHDDETHTNGGLVRAAICYAAEGSEKADCRSWLAPWGGDDFTTGERRADLIRAAALLVAEAERIDRTG